jgi:hypothetical protein
VKGTVSIRPHSTHGWRNVNEPSHDDRIVDIENWPHAFDEHPDRWLVLEPPRYAERKVLERADFAGCRICGASELSAIHLQVVT